MSISSHIKRPAPEIVKQEDFYRRLGIDPDVHHGMDGVFGGNLFENKLRINDVNEALFQAVKYASRIRIRGEKLPSNIILNDLSAEKVWIYKSEILLRDIEKIYFGAPSKNNFGYNGNFALAEEVGYKNSSGLERLLKIIHGARFIRYHVDKSNIYGLSREFYRISKLQDKNSFMKECAKSEIRSPNFLKDRIFPYEQKTNSEFAEIMDCLNPKPLQREQGAYYTPVAYVAKMQKMLLRAITEVPTGMDYAIIDRCAGVGNLERGLDDEILKHCILSTIEPNEYQILRYEFSEKSAVVIPETDALAYDIIPAKLERGKIVDDYVRKKVEDPNCVIILVENPPFSEAGSGGVQSTGKKKNLWKNSYVAREMEDEFNGSVLNELANLFIWSGFKFYLKKSVDSYILYSPTKYWRNQGLVRKKFINGFLCNRREFCSLPDGRKRGGLTRSAIGCISWKNEDDLATEQLPALTAYDIKKNCALKCEEAGDQIILRKAHKRFSEYAYEKRKFSDDSDDGILCESDGTEFKENGRQSRAKPLHNTNIIAYLVASSFSIDRKHVSLTRCAAYGGNGFHVRSDNFIEKLPLFAAATFPYDKWFKTDVYSLTYDGGGLYLKDDNFLRKCIIYTILSEKNKCRSLCGSDGRFYRNELCMDRNAAAAEALKNYTLSASDEDVTKYWRRVLSEAKKTDEYGEIMKKFPNATLGTWQIKQEINVEESLDHASWKKGMKVYKHVELNSEIKALSHRLKVYYESEILPDLFRYELLK